MIFVKGLGAPETPRLLPTDKSWLCVEMAPPRSGVTHISRDGSEVLLVATTGLPQGLAPDIDGVIWVLNDAPVATLMRVTLDGESEVFMDAVEGRPMLLTNDLCFGPDGQLYVTDSGMTMADWVVDGAVRPDYRTAAFDGRVYRIDPASGSGRILDDGIRFTNGICFGPDGHLYVNEMISGDIFRYRSVEGIADGPRELFANVMSEGWDSGFHGPDGMAFGADGRLYCAVFGERCIAVVGPDGGVVERIPTQGANPTNVAFGPDGERRMYVTEHELGQIEAFDVETSALPLYYGGAERVTVWSGRMRIHLTYGTRQRFHYHTYDLNVHGRVAGAAYPIKSSTWSLNGGPETFFYVEAVPDPGIDWTYEYKDSPAVNRLRDLGDFNVEVPVASPELRAGENELTIRVVDQDGTEEVVRVGFSWDPEPVAAELDLRDLGRFSHVQEVGQAVDGAFDLDLDQNLIRSRGPVYVDALLVLGSPHGSQEATYQVRFTDLTKVKWLGPSDFFAGHAGPTPPIGIKPGWSTAGMMALSPRNEARGFLAYGDHVGTDQEWVIQTAPPKRFIVQPRVDYRVRHQVEFRDGVDHDRFKIWPVGEPEPDAWLVEEDDSSVPASYPKYTQCSFSLFQHSGFPIEWSDIQVRPI